MVDDGSDRAHDVLQAARARRERLRAAMEELERAAAAPLPGREAEWRARLQRATEALRVTWREHVAETEADDGSFEQVLAVAPRLSNTVTRLRRDHEDVPAVIDDLGRRADSGGDPHDLRRDALTLFGRLSAHRQLGADLFYEAYNVDIGPAD